MVVFDRMREDRALDPERPLEDIVDLSLTQTLPADAVYLDDHLFWPFCRWGWRAARR